MQSPSRRAFLAGAAGAVALLASSSGANASGRLAPGGRISLRVPWPIDRLDPHVLDDATVSFFGDALFDTLYREDAGGALAPLLAEGEPRPERGALRVSLPPGLKTGHGKSLGVHDVRESLRRSARLGGAAWLQGIPIPRVDGGELVFDMQGARTLMRRLASPLLAIVPDGFNPALPDGTGPLRATRSGDALVLLRNDRAAAEGPSYLDEITVRAAPDLASSPREFERGTDDIGWLGAYYYRPRPGASHFKIRTPGAWALLRTGRDTPVAFNAPGNAQALADGIPASALQGLFVEPLDIPAGEKPVQVRWGGPPCDLLVRDDSPWLIALAEKVAAEITDSGHEVNPKPTAHSELARRLAQGAFALAIDVARSFLPNTLGVAAALAMADNPVRAVSMVRFPPQGNLSPRFHTRTMRVGVLGGVPVEAWSVGLDLATSASGSAIDFGATRRR